MQWPCIQLNTGQVDIHVVTLICDCDILLSLCRSPDESLQPTHLFSQPLDCQEDVESRRQEHYHEPLATAGSAVSPCPLVFSHLDSGHSNNTRSGTCACSAENVELDVIESNQTHICPICRKVDDDETSELEGTQEMIESFNVLRVSSPTCEATPQCVPTQSSVNPSYLPATPTGLCQSAIPRMLCRTCRQEACAPCYLDDTTVDDLAGYLDQIVFLPKPMSEMAELMYT